MILKGEREREREHRELRIAYGAITPRTSGDLGRAAALIHRSSSSSSFLAENGLSNTITSQ